MVAPRKIVKDFILSPTWDEQQASRVEAFFRNIVDAQNVVHRGTYTGTGRAQTIPVPDLPNPPKAIHVQHPDGTITSAIDVAPTFNVSAWNQKGFTVPAGSAVNVAGKVYTYVLHA